MCHVQVLCTGARCCSAAFEGHPRLPEHIRECATLDTAHAILPPNPPSQSTHDNGSPGSEDDTSAINMIRLAEEARRSSNGGMAGAGLNGSRELTRV